MTGTGTRLRTTNCLLSTCVTLLLKGRQQSVKLVSAR